MKLIINKHNNETPIEIGELTHVPQIGSIINIEAFHNGINSELTCVVKTVVHQIQLVTRFSTKQSIGIGCDLLSSKPI
jgi:hypothetical protein